MAAPASIPEGKPGLPAALEGRCGTARRATLPAAQALAAVRPVLPNQMSSTHFLVHYADGADTTYVRGVSEAAERAWRVLVDTLGCAAPPSDGTAGGDARTDVYIRTPAQIGGVFGVTYPETWVGGTYPYAHTSWFEVVDTMATARMQTVTAHEFFHVVQLGYRFYADDPSSYGSYLEMISTWAEERVFDANNTYLEVIPFFFDAPHKNLFGYTYSNVPWMIYLTERYSEDIPRDILAACAPPLLTPTNVVAAHNAVLPGYGAETMVAETSAFTLWNYFTGGRDDGAHYTEGATWPEVAVEKRSACIPFDTYPTTNRYGTYGSNYFFFDGNYQKDTLRVVINPEFYNNCTATITRFKGPQRLTEWMTFPQFTVVDSVSVADWRDCDSLLVVMNNDGGAQSSADARVSAHFPLSASPAALHVLLLDRDGCRRPFDGSGDDFSGRDGEERPWALALSALSIPFVQTDSIPGDLSRCIGVVVVGGADAGGILLSDAELGRLMAYMDGGGNVYLEGRTFGAFADPGQGSPTPAQSAFWSYFGADFIAGNPTGNVSAWQTSAGSVLGAHGFVYDFQGASDADVGMLVPVAAETLAVDGSGAVRMTFFDAGGSARVYSTVVLGASTGSGASSREGFVQALMDLWGPVTPALAVARMTVRVDGTQVLLEGELSGYDGQPLALRRGGAAGAVDVPFTLHDLGVPLLRAHDDPGAGAFTYRLSVVDDAGAEALLLWQQEVVTGAGTRPLALRALGPNPVRNRIRLTLESDRSRGLELSMFDVAGRRVWSGHERVRAGTSTLTLDGPSSLPSGIYFVRVRDGNLSVGRKVLILR